jgi:hypothetical protein
MEEYSRFSGIYLPLHLVKSKKLPDALFGGYKIHSTLTSPDFPELVFREREHWECPAFSSF